LAAFLVAPGEEGYRVGAPERTLGLRASEGAELHFEGTRVQDDALLEGDGSRGGAARTVLEGAHLGSAAQAVGITSSALEHATRYALEREQFGRPIARFEAIQDKLARMSERVVTGRELVMAAARALQETGAGRGERRSGSESASSRVAIAKVVASEGATWAADEAVQIFGGYGYMRHYPVEKLLRDAKGTEVHDGNNDTIRLVVARELLAGSSDERDRGIDATA